MRDATNWTNTSESSTQCFNPRVPCGTRLCNFRIETISALFQSTRPVRDATTAVSEALAKQQVSIHASRAGRDKNSACGHSSRSCFNPRVPCGTRPTTRLRAAITQKFQSTRPVRDATTQDYTGEYVVAVSIHASRAGRDCSIVRFLSSSCVSIHASRAGRDHGMTFRRQS